MVSFRLPAHRVAHTRHYLPWEKKGPADRTLVFDTFVAVGRSDPAYVGWPDAVLEPAGRDALGDLISNLSSLGRAERWVHAELAAGPVDWNCQPAAGDDTVPVLCPDPATALGSDHYPPAPDPTRRNRGLRPDDYLFDCPRWHLCLDTETVHAERWPRVPGARTVPYCRPPADNPRPSFIPRPSSLIRRPKPTLARFLLDGPVLPLVTDTVPVAEAVRRRVLGHVRRVVGRRTGLPADATQATHPELRSRVLFGKDDGRAVRGSHDHAFYLPTDEDGDGRIDHVPVWAAGGFGPDEVAALAALRAVEVGHLKGLRLMGVGLGRPDDFTHQLFAASRVWVSATPFVVTRHLKRRGRK